MRASISCAAAGPRISSMAAANAARSVLTPFWVTPKLRSRQLKSALCAGSPRVAKVAVTACWKTESKTGLWGSVFCRSRVIWMDVCWVVCWFIFCALCICVLLFIC